METQSKKKERIGRVVSAKMDKTVVVMVERLKMHPLVGKTIKRRRKFVAHDERNECQVNDIVQIVEARPQSKTKRWRLVKILERADV